jgi:hypothetical protein
LACSIPSIRNLDLAVINLEKVEPPPINTQKTCDVEIFGQVVSVTSPTLFNAESTVQFPRSSAGAAIGRVPSKPCGLDMQHEHLMDMYDEVENWAHYRVCGQALPKHSINTVVCVIAVVSQTLRNIVVPVLADTLSPNALTSTYSMALLASFGLTVLCSPVLVLRGLQYIVWPNSERNYPHAFLMLAGFLQAVTLLLVAYSAPSLKTRPMFQSVAPTIVIPVTIAFNVLFKPQHVDLKRIICALFILIGLTLALSPTRPNAMGLMWPVLAMSAFIPRALLHVLEQVQPMVVDGNNNETVGETYDAILQRGSAIVVFSWTSLYSFICVCLLAWTDIWLPSGSSPSFSSLFSSVSHTMSCFLGSATLCGDLLFWGTLYVLCLGSSSICIALLHRHATVTLNIIASTLPIPVSVLAWLCLTDHPFALGFHSSITTCVMIASLIPITVGVVEYHVEHASADCCEDKKQAVNTLYRFADDSG